MLNAYIIINLLLHCIHTIHIKTYKYILTSISVDKYIIHRLLDVQGIRKRTTDLGFHIRY